MSEELQAACKKIRDLSGDIGDCLLGGMPHDTVTYRGSLLHELLEASLVLQSAYLAENPAEDDEPVTRVARNYRGGEMIEVIFRWPDGRDEVRYRRNIGSKEAERLIAEVEHLKIALGPECPYRVEVRP